LVFQRQTHPVDLGDATQWWASIPGASWRHPLGPERSLEGDERHPVTQLAYEDAAAYARWAGKTLPSEAEWERAARGGLDGAIYVWGDEFLPGKRLLANVWSGQFPPSAAATRSAHRHDAGRLVPAQRVWSLRHGGQWVGVDERLLCATAWGG
jgi:formylglycine-generating enzyme required for sulfatase activity